MGRGPKSKRKKHGNVFRLPLFLPVVHFFLHENGWLRDQASVTIFIFVIFFLAIMFSARYGVTKLLFVLLRQLQGHNA